MLKSTTIHIATDSAQALGKSTAKVKVYEHHLFAHLAAGIQKVIIRDKHISSNVRRQIVPVDIAIKYIVHDAQSV